MSQSPAETIVETTTHDVTMNSKEENDLSDINTRDFGFVPIPKRLRFNPEKPFHFGLVLNCSFGFASTFIVANLYYCQPLLIQFSESFGVTYDEVSRIPTLIQAGYATGLLLISPLGDLVRRRQLVLTLVFMSTTLTIGLAITTNLQVFEAISFLIGAVTVTPQILMPLAADLAAPERRASALSVVLSGLMLGVLIARVLAGVIGNFTSWRVVYYMAIGVQCFVLAGAYLLLPDYPAKNRDLSYWQILYSMAKYAVTEPLVVQTALMNIASSACFTAFWVTLTFLLGGSPYYYSTLVIGLFGLVGMLGVLVGPFTGRLIDRLVPWYATLVATICLLVFSAVQVGAGGINVAAVIISCFGLDVARQMQQVSLSTAIFSISASARARLNAILILSLFIGQVMGTSVGTEVFVQHGWRACALLMMALYGFNMCILLLRGPHCPRTRWFGYEGGLEARKTIVAERERDRRKDIEMGKESEPLSTSDTPLPQNDKGQ
ncbi:major facilitator superfamily domain-containing protein [Hygrophoropsis aurantiaca]|uniref:Major facilitator superfamily domain-containing protein n=1 Tax=Hygrophoropsis aurantiaca TaxID=72124 RepID=A0ACB8AKB1_9AGAM|nr:major facilitator superfamily domain-containing protein [Hygrophoropsis aurantiaca]